MKRSKILAVVVTTLIVFSLFGISINQTGGTENSFNLPKTSQLTDLPYLIRIDDNWTEIVTAYDWCTGSGTELDPYVIQGSKYCH